MASRFVACAALAMLSLTAIASEAQISVRPLFEQAVTCRALGDAAGKIRILAEAESAPGFTRLTRGVFTKTATYEELLELARAEPQLALSWSPPLRPLLDRATQWVRASELHSATGYTGRGALVGVLDSGFDVTHPDFRDAMGRTRVRWLIDFSQRPVGLHPALEEAYGCTGRDIRCAIFDQEDIDRLLGSASANTLSSDPLGHGTHVASIAAGNGLSNRAPRYVGVAPEAGLLLAQVSGRDGTLDIAHVIAAAEFVFDRASELGLPVAVNVSLGTDFGAHDGSSPLARSLASFVGQSQPGRALVVAAGNSGTLYEGLNGPYPEPLGTSTEVHVPRSSSVKVPFLTLGRGSVTRGAVLVWVQGQPGDSLRVGFENDKQRQVAPVPPGQAREFDASLIDDGDEYQVLIVNAEGSDPRFGASSSALLLSGSWRSGRTFHVVLEGQGSAKLWVEGDGDLAPERGPGVLFPRAAKEGTVSIPAVHPQLIAVGATINRSSWPSDGGRMLGPLDSDPSRDLPLDSLAIFSAAGPNLLGDLKPEIVAPGGRVVGAMARSADPRRNNPLSLFGNRGRCDSPGEECFVVDDFHALTSGTSMAAPVVTGALALLLERDASLTQPELKLLLMAGARAVQGAAFEEQQIGMGRLDLVDTFLALDQMRAEGGTQGPPSESTSRLRLSRSFAYPDPQRSLVAWLSLRDADGKLSDPPEDSISVTAVGAERWTRSRQVPGLYRIELWSPAESGGSTMTLQVLSAGRPLLERRIQVAVDRPVSQGGFAARGGCSLAHAPSDTDVFWAVAGLILAVAARGRRGRSSVLDCASSDPPAGARKRTQSSDSRFANVLAVTTSASAAWGYSS